MNSEITVKELLDILNEMVKNDSTIENTPVKYFDLYHIEYKDIIYPEIIYIDEKTGFTSDTQSVIFTKRLVTL